MELVCIMIGIVIGVTLGAMFGAKEMQKIKDVVCKDCYEKIKREVINK